MINFFFSFFFLGKFIFPVDFASKTNRQGFILDGELEIFRTHPPAFESNWKYLRKPFINFKRRDENEFRNLIKLMMLDTRVMKHRLKRLTYFLMKSRCDRTWRTNRLISIERCETQVASRVALYLYVFTRMESIPSAVFVFQG